ncbi:MAG: DUF1460 domain-containing protein, partial [Muribaculaceae bacterium]|nr:DUF1460 domain-containing protein [Muribaculaceae bacterium]
MQKFLIAQFFSHRSACPADASYYMASQAEPASDNYSESAGDKQTTRHAAARHGAGQISHRLARISRSTGRMVMAATAAFVIALAGFTATGSPSGTRWHNEAADTTRITHILIDEATNGVADAGQSVMTRIGRRFAGTPYGAATLDGDTTEQLTVNLDTLDCMTFVETVAALAMTVNEGRQSWQDFLYNLEKIRYRSGVANGYPSRLHYMSAWILDNSSRGVLTEKTNDLPGVRYQIKTLDYMTRNRDKYAQLADSANFEAMKRVEAGFSNYRYPYLRANVLKNKDLLRLVADGDILVFTSGASGLDASHVGIAVVEDGTVKLLHASSKDGRVEINPLSLADYLRRNRTEGLRVVRL